MENLTYEELKELRDKLRQELKDKQIKAINKQIYNEVLDNK